MKVLIACFPKSGSTFLTGLIAALPGFDIAHYVPYYGRREQELEEGLIESPSDSEHEVAQHHVRASDYTLELIDKHDITPIVLVRNVYDCCVSYADHLSKESTVIPTAFFDEEMAEQPFERRLDAVFDLVLPWYFNFYVSWWRAKPSAIVTYEDFILGSATEKHATLTNLGLPVSLEDVTRAQELASMQASRLNVGKAGRGKQFERRYGRRVRRLAGYYSDVDFAPMGISEKRHWLRG